MSLNLGKTKITLQKKILAFLGFVPLLLATAWIPASCPACHGTGTISSYGMEYITLLGEPNIVSSPQPQKIYCGSWLVYHRDIILTLQNNGDKDVSGFIILQMIDPVSNYTSAPQTVAVFVSAGQIAPQQVHAVLEMPTDESYALPILLASIPDDNHTCEECNGTGKVMLNNWMLSKKRWELSNKRISFGERPPDIPYEEDREGWIWVPMLDLNDKLILGDDGFPIYVQIEDLGGAWIIAIDDNGEPILDPNGTPIQIFISHWS